MDIQHIRNIGIIAHIDAGKTTLTERILYYTDVIKHMGEVHDGAATMDFMQEERERGITIAAACVSCPWKDHLINIIDTPGHVDFTIEVERSLRVVDGAIGIFDATAGVEPQSERVWRQASQFSIPRLAVINKMDREGASYENTLESLHRKLGVKTAPVTIPYGEGEAFIGVIDLIREEIIYFSPVSNGREMERHPFDEDAFVYATPWREKLLDILTEEGDELLQICLSGKEPSVALIEESLKKATHKRGVVPVFAMAALKNIGIQPVLDAILSYLPSPKDTALPLPLQNAIQKKERISKNVVYCGLVFKVALIKGEKILFVRSYLGDLAKQQVLSVLGKEYTVHSLFRVYAEEREPLDIACQGDIFAVTGINASTGDTLVFGIDVNLEPIVPVPPVISMVFEARRDEDIAPLSSALERALIEDPTLQLNDEEGRTLISGMGELQLEVLRDRLEREYGIEIRMGNPHVVCREVITAEVEKKSDLSLDILGEREHCSLHLRLSANLEGNENRVITDGVSVPETARVQMTRGITDACSIGNFGYPVVGYVVTVLGISDSFTENGVYLAAKYACAEALKEAKTNVQEPVMRVIITVPNDFVGNVLSLLGSCAVQVEDCVSEAMYSTIHAKGYLKQLFGFATRLRSSTQGRGDLFMEFSHYASGL